VKRNGIGRWAKKGKRREMNLKFESYGKKGGDEIKRRV
jgi:hypothetical protein